MKTYKVSGYAMVPVLAEMIIEAPSPTTALKIAKDRWERAEGGKHRFIVPGTEDDTAVHDWQPHAELHANTPVSEAAQPPSL